MNRILVLYPAASHPVFSGSRSVTVSYCEYLKNLGYDVYFMCISESISTLEEAEMKKYWGDKLIIFKPKFYKWQKRFYKYFRRLIKGRYTLKVDDWYPMGLTSKIESLQKEISFDTLWVNYIWLSRSLESVSCSNKILYVHDVFSDRNEITGANWFSTSSKEEGMAISRADSVLSLQDEETTFLSNLTKKKVISVYANFEVRPTEIVYNKNILFLASANSHNIEAIHWFISNVLAELKKVDPEIELLIGGSICESIKDLGDGVKLLGKFNNLSDFYGLGNIIINPVFTGTGLKIKTFEAMSYGKVLITHPHNTIGIPNFDSSSVLLAIDKMQYIEHISGIVSDYTKIKELKKKNEQYVHFVNSLFETSLSEALTIK